MTVKCSGCGEEIRLGWMRRFPVLDGKKTLRGYLETDQFYCDDCESMAGKHRCEFRTCDVCNHTITAGFVVSDGEAYLCEDCFDGWMDEYCPDGWRVNDHKDCEMWGGGYYDELVDGEWVDTGIYYTEWV